MAANAAEDGEQQTLSALPSPRHKPFAWLRQLGEDAGSLLAVHLSYRCPHLAQCSTVAVLKFLVMYQGVHVLVCTGRWKFQSHLSQQFHSLVYAQETCIYGALRALLRMFMAVLFLQKARNPHSTHGWICETERWGMKTWSRIHTTNNQVFSFSFFLYLFIKRQAKRNNGV